MLALGALASALVAVHEWRVAGLADEVATATREPFGSDTRDVLARDLAVCEHSNDDRVLLNCVAGYSALALQAAGAPEGSRFVARTLDADSRLQRISPALGTAQIMHALALSTAGRDRAAALALRKSYTLTPYSPQGGVWRLWWGGRHWQLLDMDTRRALEIEALWYGSQGQSQRQAVIDAIDDTPAYLPVALRLPGRVLEATPLPPAHE
ncbi:hypothetical protein KY084_03370 [Stakelama sp. CBK3Z-3]|uniref:Uncharacterized protein n=1 Tax=Stakelama flava TaxID=2860338 RepID=A0ABS6XJ50_9SPHN|nr:hypothetical protein [Stakelama flava]MBW4329914.1 hypothetical protein [Stakelama flava]